MYIKECCFMELELFINEVNEWVDILDCDFEELKEKLQKDTCYITDVDSDFNYSFEGAISLSELEDLADKINELDNQCAEDEFKALMEYLGNFEEAYSTWEAGKFSYYPDVKDREELGQYVVDEGLWGEIPENLINYIDYEAIGRDIDLNARGCFTENGFIELY